MGNHFFMLTLIPKKGVALAVAISIGSILMLLAVAMFSFINNQHLGINAIVNGEIAHFLAEAGINRCIPEIRNSISSALSTNPNNKKLREILLTPGKVKDSDITKLLGGSWNKELEKFAKETDETAAIEVKIWLRELENSETDKKVWADPIARRGFVVIESEGRYKTGKRKIAIKRLINVTNILPGFMSKFTMFLTEAGNNGTKKYNIIKNDYKGMVTDGPKPLILYNHLTPETPSANSDNWNFDEALKSEQNEDIWKNRGWIWIGGDKIRLNLCSGAGDLGEIFHFYDVSKVNDFSPIRFSTPENLLPSSFKNINKIPWDKTASIIRTVSYKFGHSFVLDSFHDRSNRKSSDAMYEGGILSTEELHEHGSKSSVLHLYGDARKGFQSRTKVFGNVYSAFIRFSNLEIEPKEPDVSNIFKSVFPPPLYLLRSIIEKDYSNSIDIKEINQRICGGPMLKTGMLFNNYSEYSSFMSKIIEQPYVYSYNNMQEIYTNKPNRHFPPSKTILSLDTDSNISLRRDNHTFFEGKPSASTALQTIESRVHLEVGNIKEFWDKFLNEDQELDLNAVVRIKNSENLDFAVPPSNLPQPLKVRGGGAILLDQGSIDLRGVLCNSANEALTIASTYGTNIYFSSNLPNHVNIIAPNAELSYSSKFILFGSLCAKNIYVDNRFQGGKIYFRPETAPDSSFSDSFYKVYVSTKDSYWNE